MEVCHRAFSDSDFAGGATRVLQRYRPLAMSTIVQKPVFAADATLEWSGGAGALGESVPLSSSSSSWKKSGCSALSPRRRKKPAMVAERKMSITLSGHIVSPFLPSPSPKSPSADKSLPSGALRGAVRMGRGGRGRGAGLLWWADSSSTLFDQRAGERGRTRHHHAPPNACGFSATEPCFFSFSPQGINKLD